MEYPQYQPHPITSGGQAKTKNVITADLDRKITSTLGQRINDRINLLQADVERLQLLRSKLQAGKIDSIGMDELSKALGYY